MSGVSVTTRFLYSVLSGKVYAGKKKQQEPLHNLVSCFAKDIGNCFHQEIPVQSASWTEKIFLICLGLKRDLAALVKLGKLQRNYMRDTMSGKGAGICHLCRGGQENFSYHETDFNIMTEMRRDAPLPWTQQPSLLNSIPHSPSRKAAFFKLDLFHILLKGVFGDIAANAIVSCYDLKVFGNLSLEKFLKHVYDDASGYCRQNGLQLHMIALTTDLLGIKRASSYPTASWFKGADTSTLCTYLQAKLGTLANLEPEHQHYMGLIHKVVKSANEFMRTLLHSGNFLLDSERAAALLHGKKVLEYFKQLAT
ncbi:unnamed protein product [Symbiodinium pilosum]|uniref:Uncharacterized protein n=1 Tax=Symbiodinium pilosum TaxID=2952 RepID=A0A812MJN8_SYMPI|nr:unnamed protein product [Symbiodinium pilosum]